MHTLEVQARYIILHILNSPQWVQIISEGVFSFIFCSSETSLFHSFAHHCKFLGYWSTQNSVWRILQRFSCLPDEGIPKIWKKLNSHDGFLSYLQNSTASSAHLVVLFSPALVSPQEATARIQFLPYFGNPLIK